MWSLDKNWFRSTRPDPLDLYRKSTHFDPLLKLPILQSLANHTSESRMIWSIACFISQRPRNNTCMVFIPFHHANNTIQHRWSPSWFLWRMLEVVRKIKTVCLDIGLVYHVHSKQITQLIPSLMLRIMTVSHSIYIIFFHQYQILHHKQNIFIELIVWKWKTRKTKCHLNHARFNVCLSYTWMMFMPVYPSYYDWMPINKQLFRGFWNLPYAHLAWFTLDNIAWCVFQCDYQRIKIWLQQNQVISRCGKVTRYALYRLKRAEWGFRLI